MFNAFLDTVVLLAIVVILLRAMLIASPSPTLNHAMMRGVRTIGKHLLRTVSTVVEFVLHQGYRWSLSIVDRLAQLLNDRLQR